MLSMKLLLFITQLTSPLFNLLYSRDYDSDEGVLYQFDSAKLCIWFDKEAVCI
jgi:hypothetical protein